MIIFCVTFLKTYSKFFSLAEFFDFGFNDKCYWRSGMQQKEKNNNNFSKTDIPQYVCSRIDKKLEKVLWGAPFIIKCMKKMYIIDRQNLAVSDFLAHRPSASFETKPVIWYFLSVTYDILTQSHAYILKV